MDFIVYVKGELHPSYTPTPVYSSLGAHFVEEAALKHQMYSSLHHLSNWLLGEAFFLLHNLGAGGLMQTQWLDLSTWTCRCQSDRSQFSKGQRSQVNEAFKTWPPPCPAWMLMLYLVFQTNTYVLCSFSWTQAESRQRTECMETGDKTETLRCWVQVKTRSKAWPDSFMSVRCIFLCIYKRTRRSILVKPWKGPAEGSFHMCECVAWAIALMMSQINQPLHTHCSAIGLPIKSSPPQSLIPIRNRHLLKVVLRPRLVLQEFSGEGY